MKIKKYIKGLSSFKLVSLVIIFGLLFENFIFCPECYTTFALEGLYDSSLKFYNVNKTASYFIFGNAIYVLFILDLIYFDIANGIKNFVVLLLLFPRKLGKFLLKFLKKLKRKFGVMFNLKSILVVLLTMFIFEIILSYINGSDSISIYLIKNYFAVYSVQLLVVLKTGLIDFYNNRRLESILIISNVLYTLVLLYLMYFISIRNYYRSTINFLAINLYAFVKNEVPGSMEYDLGNQKSSWGGVDRESPFEQYLEKYTGFGRISDDAFEDVVAEFDRKYSPPHDYYTEGSEEADGMLEANDPYDGEMPLKFKKYKSKAEELEDEADLDGIAFDHKAEYFYDPNAPIDDFFEGSDDIVQEPGLDDPEENFNELSLEHNLEELFDRRRFGTGVDDGVGHMFEDDDGMFEDQFSAKVHGGLKPLLIIIFFCIPVAGIILNEIYQGLRYQNFRTPGQAGGFAGLTYIYGHASDLKRHVPSHGEHNEIYAQYLNNISEFKNLDDIRAYIGNFFLYIYPEQMEQLYVKKEFNGRPIYDLGKKDYRPVANEKAIYLLYKETKRSVYDSVVVHYSTVNIRAGQEPQKMMRYASFTLDQLDKLNLEYDADMLAKKSFRGNKHYNFNFMYFQLVCGAASIVIFIIYKIVYKLLKALSLTGMFIRWVGNFKKKHDHYYFKEMITGENVPRPYVYDFMMDEFGEMAQDPDLRPFGRIKQWWVNMIQIHWREYLSTGTYHYEADPTVVVNHGFDESPIEGFYGTRRNFNTNSKYKVKVSNKAKRDFQLRNDEETDYATYDDLIDEMDNVKETIAYVLYLGGYKQTRNPRAGKPVLREILTRVEGYECDHYGNMEVFEGEIEILEILKNYLGFDIKDQEVGNEGFLYGIERERYGYLFIEEQERLEQRSKEQREAQEKLMKAELEKMRAEEEKNKPPKLDQEEVRKNYEMIVDLLNKENKKILDRLAKQQEEQKNQ